ncbi:MAG: histidine kinase [Candidatus Eisenbacteria bacterium]|uniref:Histidine kinase n=1 Tax=Eiseniibacteriota bacterium TaxID=2212470 RepID=A0A538UAF3_UNCEI|nr:MAG: histidine kinase [Candidatus Eisenbacteria bacterium]
MPYRVQDILLVSSLYDSFTLQEDGRLNELILGEFVELSLHHTPGLTHVSSGAEALARAEAERRFNLILTTIQLGDMDASQLAREVRRRRLDASVVVLAYDNTERKDFVARRDTSDIDRIFMWQGNARILVAIVKYLEDKRNVEHDTATVGVPVLLLVEDNVRYYSSFLPTIYTELIHQSERLISEGINLSHKLVRMRARPKILLSSTFEEAWDLFTRYRPFVLGLISDVEFPRGGHVTRGAGFELARMARQAIPDLPILLQSSRVEFAAEARAMGAAFLRKYSDTLLADLRSFMIEQFAFGDFVFRMPDGREVGRAADLKSLETQLLDVPAESIGYHGERNHFSNWFTARTEFALARKLKPRKVSDFATLEDLRHDLIASIADYRREQSETLVADFDRHTFDAGANFFARIGGGSLGGKARGLAFARYLLGYHAAARRFPGVHIAVPPAVVLATDCFDRFLAEHHLLDLALHSHDDGEIERRFLAEDLPGDVLESLRQFLKAVRWPLAVRSSSLLEDSQYQPFTGVYETFMLPNDAPSLERRLARLSTAIRRVYASTFLRRAKAYLRATPYRLEEEKMAVLVQQVVGERHGSRYYPDFSGVARSHNFYPSPPLTPEDGVAAVALGMGRTVVEGGKSLLFCPRDPRHLAHFSTVEDILAHSQREFWALDLERTGEETMRETSFGLEAAEGDGTLYALGSTYSPDSHSIHDGLAREGPRLVTFAPVLKHGVFPLADILSHLLDIGRHGMNRPAEIEFAVRLSRRRPERHTFGFLQMRPLVLTGGFDEQDLDAIPSEGLLCRSPMVLGNGTLELSDVVVIDIDRYDRSASREVAQEIARFNAELSADERPYLLIGVGRWGSADPWLGIPVTWEQIAGARVIVESGFRDMRVTPSQGSHFFQNLTSFQIGYFTVNADAGEGFVRWDWLAAQPAVSEHSGVRHLRFESALVVRMDGARGAGVIELPGALPEGSSSGLSARAQAP